MVLSGLPTSISCARVRGSKSPFLGSLFSVDWDLLLRRQASDPLRRVEATAVGSSPEHSTFQVHAIFGVSLVAMQNREVSSSAWVSAAESILATAR